MPSTQLAQREAARMALIWYLPDVCSSALSELLNAVRPLAHEPTLDTAREATRAWTKRYFGVEPGVSDWVGHWLVEKMLDQALHFSESIPLSWRVGCRAGIPELTLPSARNEKNALLQGFCAFSNPFEGVSMSELPPHDLFAARVGHAAALSPPGADPSMETLDEYLEKATLHYRARADELKRAGFAVARKRQAVEIHARWFLRYQVNRESAKTIKAQEPLIGPERAIKLAVDRLAKLVELPVRSLAANK